MHVQIAKYKLISWLEITFSYLDKLKFSGTHLHGNAHIVNVQQYLECPNYRRTVVKVEANLYEKKLSAKLSLAVARVMPNSSSY